MFTRLAHLLSRTRTLYTLTGGLQEWLGRFRLKASLARSLSDARERPLYHDGGTSRGQKCKSALLTAERPGLRSPYRRRTPLGLQRGAGSITKLNLSIFINKKGFEP